MSGVKSTLVKGVDETSKALQRIARGAGIVFAGTIISMLFGFLGRAVIARYLSVSEYGVFNLALTVLSIALIVATLGFQNSLPREVAYYREKEPSKIRNLTSTALAVALVNSIIWTGILFLEAGSTSQLFRDERLAYALRIMILALPFWTLTAVITSVSRGFGRVREQVYFQNIAYPTAFLVLVVAGVLLKAPFAFIFIAYVIAQAVTLLLLVFDVGRSGLFEFGLLVDLRLGKELIRFSIPLMLTGIAGFVMTWTDTLMLGYYKTSEVVGTYNGAAPIARLLPVFLGSAGVIYPSLATAFYASGRTEELRRVYQILTKWIFLATFPLFALVSLFPEATINFFFGEKYASAASALQILALGFMFHTFLGLNGLSLIVIRESNFVMYSTLVSAGINVALNALLIPVYGIEGAATATTASYLVTNALNSLRLYQRTAIHPFSRNYVKILVVGFALSGVILASGLRAMHIWYAILILAVFFVAYLLLILLSRSIDREDIELLLAMEQRLGVNLEGVKKVLRRFV